MSFHSGHSEYSRDAYPAVAEDDVVTDLTNGHTTK